MNFIELSTNLFSLVLSASLAATVLGLVVLVCEQLFRQRLSSAWLFALFLPVLLRLLVPVFPESPASLFNLQHRFAFLQPAPAASTFQETPANRPNIPAQATVASTPAPSISHIPPRQDSSFATDFQYCALVWLIITAILLLRLAVGALRLNHLLARQPAAPASLTALLAQLRAEIRTRFQPCIIETALVQTPCLFGLFRPKLLLPSGLSQRLGTDELSHVILHELAHLKRGDLLVNSFMALAQSIHWFNPLVWLIFRRMRLHRELACDQLVLQTRQADPAAAKAYGETLLKLVQEFSPRSRPLAPSVVGIVEGHQTAEARLRQIAAFNPHRRRTLVASLAGLATLLVLVAIGLSNAQTGRTPPATPAAQPAANLAPEENIPSASVNPAPADLRQKNINALEEAYARQKSEVDDARDRLNQLRRQLRITSLDETGASANHDQTLAQDRIRNISESHTFDSALLEHLRKMNRQELRKTLPTILRPPDELLNRYLADLGAAEQKFALLSGSYSDGHPEVAAVRDVLETINKQIETRIDGIIAGLEARSRVARDLTAELQKVVEEARARDIAKQEHLAPYFEAKRRLENAERAAESIFLRLLAEKVDAQIAPKSTPQKR